MLRELKLKRGARETRRTRERERELELVERLARRHIPERLER